MYPHENMSKCNAIIMLLESSSYHFQVTIAFALKQVLGKKSATQLYLKTQLTFASERSVHTGKVVPATSKNVCVLQELFR